MKEKILISSLKEKLSPKFKSIFIHKNLTHLHEFKAVLKSKFGYIPVLNEIDMILITKDGHFCAVEAKCFEVKNGKITRPFYDGVGQALSLLRYGFDYVALWHFFAGRY